MLSEPLGPIEEAFYHNARTFLLRLGTAQTEVGEGMNNLCVVSGI